MSFTGIMAQLSKQFFIPHRMASRRSRENCFGMGEKILDQAKYEKKWAMGCQHSKNSSKYLIKRHFFCLEKIETWSTMAQKYATEAVDEVKAMLRKHCFNARINAITKVELFADIFICCLELLQPRTNCLCSLSNNH